MKQMNGNRHHKILVTLIIIVGAIGTVFFIGIVYMWYNIMTSHSDHKEIERKYSVYVKTPDTLVVRTWNGDTAKDEMFYAASAGSGTEVCSLKE